jgi:serine/threonine-protein kinase
MPNAATALASVEEARDPHIAKDYQVARVAARGGMGRVLEARRRHDRRPVAIKVLHPELVGDYCCRRQIKEEARVLRLAAHPLVVELIDDGETAAGQPYLVLEWLDGRNLKHMIMQDGALRPERALGIFCAALDSLQLVHDRGIVHGDVKPENFMVVKTRLGGEGVRLLDFGISTMRREPDADADEVYGTPGYLAPELYMAKAPSVASDVYAAGVCLFEMLTSRSPFLGQTRSELWKEQVERPLPEMSPWIDGADGELDALVHRALAVKPADRFESANHFKREFRRVMRRLCTRREKLREEHY